jgi:hypothetical protein
MIDKFKNIIHNLPESIINKLNKENFNEYSEDDILHLIVRIYSTGFNDGFNYKRWCK